MVWQLSAHGITPTFMPLWMYLDRRHSLAWAIWGDHPSQHGFRFGHEREQFPTLFLTWTGWKGEKIRAYCLWKLLPIHRDLILFAQNVVVLTRSLDMEPCWEAQCRSSTYRLLKHVLLHTSISMCFDVAVGMKSLFRRWKRREKMFAHGSQMWLFRGACWIRKYDWGDIAI